MDFIGDDLLERAGTARIRPMAARKAALFALICAVWLGVGLLGRDPWKPQETYLVAVVADLADNGLRLVPELLGQPFLETPPLLAWLGALSARALPFLEVHEAARVASALMVAAGLLFVYLAVAGRCGARVGWLAALLAVGVIGFAPRAHWFQQGVPEFAAAAAALWGAMLLANNTLAGAVVLGSATGFLFLSAGIAESAVLFVAVFAAVFANAHWRGAREKMAALAGTTMFALPWVLIWPLALAGESGAMFGEWLAAEAPFAGGVSVSLFADLLKTAAWAAFPALPILAAGVVAGGREFARDPLAALCLAMCGAGAVLFLHDGNDEIGIFFAVPALAAGAARTVQRAPENRAAALDWFALLVLGMVGVGGLWLAWLARWTGFPAEVAAWTAAQTAGVSVPPAGAVAAGAAAVLTLLWAALLTNFRRSNERAVVNWSCGVTVAWCVFNLLWLPQVDAVKSYRGVAEEVSRRLDGGCVWLDNIPRDAAAQLDYFGTGIGGEECGFWLVPAGKSDGGEWEVVWRGGRPGDRTEGFELRRRD